MQSRLTRRVEKQNKKQLYLSILGLVVFLIAIIKLGPPILALLGNAIDLISPKSQQSLDLSNAPLQTPILDTLPPATPSSKIKVTGKSFYKEGEIELYLNDSLFKKTSVDEKGDFSFEDVTLIEGDNYIKARQTKNGKKSDYSEEKKITYIKNQPKLDINSPSDKATFKKADQEITVNGKTDPDNKVTINGFVAIVDSVGNFSYVLKLNEGDNKIKIEATNPVDMKTSKEITVSYNP